MGQGLLFCLPQLPAWLLPQLDLKDTRAIYKIEETTILLFSYWWQNEDVNTYNHYLEVFGWDLILAEQSVVNIHLSPSRLLID